MVLVEHLLTKLGNSAAVAVFIGIAVLQAGQKPKSFGRVWLESASAAQAIQLLLRKRLHIMDDDSGEQFTAGWDGCCTHIINRFSSQTHICDHFFPIVCFFLLLEFWPDTHDLVFFLSYMMGMIFNILLDLYDSSGAPLDQFAANVTSCLLSL